MERRDWFFRKEAAPVNNEEHPIIHKISPIFSSALEKHTPTHGHQAESMRAAITDAMSEIRRRMPNLTDEEMAAIEDYFEGRHKAAERVDEIESK